MQTHQVRALLMGGQACVFYGAAEFSRDADFAILADTANLSRLRRALAELDAHLIAAPPLELRYLRRGHAVHFRCQAPEVKHLRVDIMSRMRGVSAFPALWRRRTTVALSGGPTVNLMGIEDLVRAKKTQRDRDWPMIRRLLEAHYFGHRDEATPQRVRFWLLELRTAALLVEAARANSGLSRRLRARRPLLEPALSGELSRVEESLRHEEMSEREKDREYWEPLRRELERLRRVRSD